MGAVQLKNMKTGVSSQIKTPFVVVVVFLLVIWSLMTLDMSALQSTVETTNVDSSIQSEMASGIEISPATPESIPETTNSPSKPISERPLILYAYADSEEGTSLKNLEFFIRHGLHAAADFIFILNGETDVASLIPNEDNIKIVQRPNDCYDLGAYAEILTNGDLCKGYKKFIMLNASLRGPFMPYWSNSCWSDMYLSKLTDEVKLVGMTANCWPTFHVQSMIWATDIIGLQTLLFPPESALNYLTANPIMLPAPKNREAKAATEASGIEWVDPEDNDLPRLSTPAFVPGINNCFHTWDSAVAAEISATSLIKAAGYKVDAMMSAFHGMSSYEQGESCGENSDVLREKEYFGINVHPFETGWMKSNRDADPLGIKRHSQWMDGRNYRSYDYCGVV